MLHKEKWSHKLVFTTPNQIIFFLTNFDLALGMASFPLDW
jgi:hypothetical protein